MVFRALLLPSRPQQDHDLIMVGVSRPPGVPEPPERPERHKADLIPTFSPPQLKDARPDTGAGRSSELPLVPQRKIVDETRAPGTSHLKTSPPDEIRPDLEQLDVDSSDAAQNAREAQEMVHNELDDIPRELSQLENGNVGSAIKVRTDRAIREFDVVIKMGQSAPPSRVLVTVLLYADSENQVQKSQAEVVTQTRRSCRLSKKNSLWPEYHSGQHLLAWVRSKSGQQTLKLAQVFSPSRVLAAFLSRLVDSLGPRDTAKS
jgi:hypothetical protein